MGNRAKIVRMLMPSTKRLSRKGGWTKRRKLLKAQLKDRESISEVTNETDRKEINYSVCEKSQTDLIHSEVSCGVTNAEHTTKAQLKMNVQEITRQALQNASISLKKMELLGSAFYRSD